MDNNYLIKNILEKFNFSLEEIQKFDLGYRITRFITNNVELISYSTRTKDFIFYSDEQKVENFISVYEAYDKKDKSEGIIIEMIIGEKKEKEIIFLSEQNMYLITESKWGKIINSSILKDQIKINKILNIIDNDLEFLFLKINKYKNKLRYRGYLNKKVSEKVVDNFRLNFLTKVA